MTVKYIKHIKMQLWQKLSWLFSITIYCEKSETIESEFFSSHSHRSYWWALLHTGND